MKDEEKRIFEEWFEEKKEKCEVYGNGDDFWVDDEIKKFCLMGYELGLKAGRPQWHDLEKDPNDLPKGYAENTRFLCSVKGETLFLIRYGSFWQGNFEVDAWCEIPTFEKE